jgi:hypothetical protein
MDVVAHAERMARLFAAIDDAHNAPERSQQLSSRMIGEGSMRQYHRLVFASKDDAAQQFVPKLTKIVRRR